MYVRLQRHQRARGSATGGQGQQLPSHEIQEDVLHIRLVEGGLKAARRAAVKRITDQPVEEVHHDHHPLRVAALPPVLPVSTLTQHLHLKSARS